MPKERWRAGQSQSATSAQVSWGRAIHDWGSGGYLFAASEGLLLSTRIQVRPWLWFGHLEYNSWILFDSFYCLIRLFYSVKCYSPWWWRQLCSLRDVWCDIEMEKHSRIVHYLVSDQRQKPAAQLIWWNTYNHNVDKCFIHIAKSWHCKGKRRDKTT